VAVVAKVAAVVVAMVAVAVMAMVAAAVMAMVAVVAWWQLPCNIIMAAWHGSTAVYARLFLKSHHIHPTTTTRAATTTATTVITMTTTTEQEEKEECRWRGKSSSCLVDFFLLSSATSHSVLHAATTVSHGSCRHATTIAATIAITTSSS